jgi:hypothetical protein
MEVKCTTDVESVCVCCGGWTTKIGTVLVLPKYMVNRLSNVIAQSFCCSIFITLFVIVFFHTQTDSTSCMSSCQPGIEETDLIEEQVDFLE